MHSILYMMPRTTRFQTHSIGSPKYAPQYALETRPSTLLIALDCTLPTCLTVGSQVRSQDALRYATGCTRLHTPSTLDIRLQSMLPTTLARTFQEVLLSAAYLVHLGVETRRVAGARRQAVCGRWLVAGDVWRAAYSVKRAACGGWGMMAEIMTSVDIVV